MAVFEGKKSRNDIIINDTMRDDKVVASDVPPRYLVVFFFLFFLLTGAKYISVLCCMIAYSAFLAISLKHIWFLFVFFSGFFSFCFFVLFHISFTGR